MMSKLRAARAEARQAAAVEKSCHKERTERQRAEQDVQRREHEDETSRRNLLYYDPYARQRPAAQLLGLGVVLRDGERGKEVWTWADRAPSRRLGPLAGAQAGIGGPVKTTGAGTAIAATAAFGVIGAVGALGARGSRPFAYVVFPDGTLNQSELMDKQVIARVQADVLRFNMLAAEGSGNRPAGPTT